MQLIIRRKAVEVADFAEASKLYDAARTKSGQGVRTFPDGEIKADRATIARVSYNAKIWPVEPWAPGQVPLYDPYQGAAA